MARRKKSKGRKGFFARSAKYVRRGTKSSNAHLVQLDAMIYGAVRAPVSNFVQNAVPLPVIGNIGDEVAMGLLNWLVAKNTSGMVRDIAVKGLVVENARLGESVATMTGLAGVGTTAGTSTAGYLYG